MVNINKDKKYHFLYKTTNLKDGKFYIGAHSTYDLNDGYLGSGYKLRRSIIKYGKENFKLEILEFFQDKNSLYIKENQVVDSKLLLDPLCMNLKEGGTGGWPKTAIKSFKQKLQDPEYKNKFIEKTKCFERLKKLHIDGKVKYDTFTGKKHKIETIEKMKISKKNTGLKEANSQYGKIWITNGIENKKIKKELEIPINWYRGRVVTEEFKKNVKAGLVGKIITGIASTPEKEFIRKQKISESMKNRLNKNIIKK